MIASVVMPVYNEEKYIANCIESLLKQDFPREEMEWIFVDGMSDDKTAQIISEYTTKYPELIRIASNPRKIVPYAMNIGISEAKGKYIIRLDAHAEYSPDYISKCIHYLDTVDAENVGGVAMTKSENGIGSSIAKLLSSKFGVGNSRFRTGGKSGYVDTVPFGAFRREVFTKYGGYDERLVRNQDNEMNYRIRKNGGKIYLADDIVLSYFCRDTVSGLIKQAFTTGMWNVITTKLCPGSMSIRHYIPLLFVLSLIILPILSIVLWPFGLLFLSELALYLLLDIVFSLKAADHFNEFFVLLFLFPAYHVCYGAGSILGIIKLPKYCKGNYKPKSI